MSTNKVILRLYTEQSLGQLLIDLGIAIVDLDDEGWAPEVLQEDILAECAEEDHVGAAKGEGLSMGQAGSAKWGLGGEVVLDVHGFTPVMSNEHVMQYVTLL